MAAFKNSHFQSLVPVECGLFGEQLKLKQVKLEVLASGNHPRKAEIHPE